MGLFDLGGATKRRRKPRRYTAERVHLNKNGYERGGRYWGVGERLYYVCDSEKNACQHVRAPSAKSAIRVAVANPRAWR